MHSSDFTPAFATAAETADAVRKKKISASELMSMTFQRIDLHNPKLNAIVWQDREQAMARAKHADEALAKGNASGALHGVPVTIKESFAASVAWLRILVRFARSCSAKPLGERRSLG